MDKEDCLAQLNLLGINCTDTYDILDADLSKDTFVLNQSEEYGAGYLSYADHRGEIQSTLFLKYSDMVIRASQIALERIEKKHG